MKNVYSTVVVSIFLALTAFGQIAYRPSIPAPMGITVNSFTGNVFYQRNDQSLRGTGYRIYQSFYYNAAQDTLNYGYGHGWSFYYNVFYKETGNQVIIHRADARKDTFLLQAGSYRSPAGVFDLLTKNGSQFVLTSKNGEQSVFADPIHKKLTRLQDANGNFVNIQYTNSLPTQITNSSGRSLLLTWENGLLKEAKDETDPAKKYTYLYNPSKDLIAVVDPLGGRKSFTYRNHYLVRLGDENNNPVVIYYAGNGGRVKLITSCNTEQRFTFLGASRKTFVSQKSQNGNLVTGYSFDEKGRLIMLKNADGHQAEFTYDEKNNLLTQKDFKGLITRFSYDSHGNVLNEIDPLGNTIAYTYEAVLNHPITIKDKRGNVTTITYDSKGNITSIVKPGNVTETYTYDSAGRRLTAQNANNNTATYQYNSDGDLTKVQYPVGAIEYQYNGNCCNVGKIIDANGNSLEMTYDLLNRTKTIKDGLGNVTSYEYDPAGNVVKETDPTGHVKEYGYDGLNRLTSVKLAIGTWHYEYDGQSNLVKMTDANNHSTHYTFDKKNQLIKETDPLGKSVSYSYDASGNLTQRNDPNGNVVSYKYDELDRLIEKSYPGNIDKYSYDESGNLISAYNNHIAYSFDYDNLNRLLRKNILTWNKSLSYTYDAVGNRKTMTDHDGGVTTYTYDNNNRLTSLTNPTNLTTTFSYDAGGRIKKQTNGNGTFTTYHYDTAGRMDSLINWKNNTEKISFFYYTFDSFGNRKTMTDKRGLNTYTYDSAYRLTNVVYADGSTEGFTMDGSGNRTQRIKNGLTTNYSYNAADQIQTAGPTSFTFDANGNTIGQQEGALRQYRYDGENRLLEAQLNPLRRVQYKYDPFGDKIEKIDTLNNVIRMVYDGDDLLAELSSANITQNLFTTALAIDSWLSMRTGGNTYFYHKDALNSIAELTGSNAEIANQYNYDAYGNIVAQSGTILNTILYTGRLLENATKLYNYRTRLYDPSTGRFTKKDVYSGVMPRPQSLNRYIYVEGNPTTYNDPKGEFIPLIPIAIAIGTSALISGGIEFGLQGAGMLMGKRKDFCWEDIGYAAMLGGALGPLSKTKELAPVVAGITQRIGIRIGLPSNAVGGAAGWLISKVVPLPVTGTAKGIIKPFLPEGCPPEEEPKGNEDPLPNPPNQTPETPVTPVGAVDPNEIIGPAGYDTLRWVSSRQNLPYKVLFENDPDFATAPAQNVTIYVPIHPKLNPASLRISDFGFGSFNFTVPANSSVYTNRLDVRDSLGVFVDVTAGLDIANRRAFWVFQSIDPNTGLAATLPVNSGFLPVNDTTKHNGEGYVTYTIQPSSLAQTRDTISAKASIIFDTEETISTNSWVNTIDAVAPTSNINALTSVVDSVFTVSWIGQDDANGSGLKDYVLYVSKNNGPFVLYKDKLTTITEQFTGEPGSTLSFYTRATDKAGNFESAKNIGDRVVTVKMPGTSNAVCPGSSVSFNVPDEGSGATYQWQVNTGSGFTSIQDNTIYSGTTGPQLIIQTAGNSYSGHQYRCQITQSGNVTYSAARKLRFSSNWLGIAGESWHNPANWSCGIVPDEFTNVIISGNTPSKPVLNSNGTCSSLTMTSQGSIMFKDTAKLNLTGK